MKYKLFIFFFAIISTLGVSSFADETGQVEVARRVVIKFLSAIENKNLNAYKDIIHPNSDASLMKVWRKWEKIHNRQSLDKLSVISGDDDIMILRADIMTISQKRSKSDIIFILQKWSGEWKILDLTEIDQQFLG